MGLVFLGGFQYFATLYIYSSKDNILFNPNPKAAPTLQQGALTVFLVVDSSLSDIPQNHQYDFEAQFIQWLSSCVQLRN